MTTQAPHTIRGFSQQSASNGSIFYNANRRLYVYADGEGAVVGLVVVVVGA